MAKRLFKLTFGEAFLLQNALIILAACFTLKDCPAACSDEQQKPRSFQRPLTISLGVHSVVPPTVQVRWSGSFALSSAETLAERRLTSSSIDGAPNCASAAYAVGWILQRLHTAVSLDIEVF